MRATRRTLMSRPITMPWYRAGGAPAPVFAYQPQGAPDLAASYVNLAWPGMHDAREGVAPAFAEATGWTFNGSTTWLDSGLGVKEGWTFLIQYVTPATNQFVCGCWNSPRGFGLAPSAGGGVAYYSGASANVPPGKQWGVCGVAGAQPYRMGLADGGALAAWGGTIGASFAIGRMGNYGAGFFTGTVQKAALWAETLTAAQVAAIVEKMYPLWTAFGDSITSGTGASDDSHKWVNIVAAAKGWTPTNSGLSSTVLQNTVQNTVATIGAAASNNGRDTYLARVVLTKPMFVTILYGLNDLRLNDAAFSAENFGNDLGEIVDGLVAGGIAASRICIGSPPYVPEAIYASYAPWDGGSRALHAAHTASCAAVATAKGTKYVDVYQYMTDHGGDALVSVDGIHPNDAGHAAIADAFLLAL